MRITGARALIKTLEDLDVEVMFGIPGGVLLPIFDEIFDSDIRFILTRHEQGAIHAADGYARATGKVGVCIATSGPGATNLITGIANAHMDSVPIVAITGQVATNLIGTDAFQEADTTGISLPIVKHNYLVKDAKELTDVLREAFYIASTGRQGPVLIDVPVDVARAEINEKTNKDIRLPGYKPTLKGHQRQIEAAAKAVLRAKKPIVYAGGGVIAANASEELRHFVREQGIPATTTLMGKGCVPDLDPLSLGMLGMHGTRYANYAVMDSDLIIAVGARFDDRITGKVSEFATGAKVIHIDVDPAEISKIIPAAIPIVGDAKDILSRLNSEIERLLISEKHSKADLSKWIDKINLWRMRHPLDYEREADEIKPQYVIECINRLTKGDAIVTTEVGQNQMWAAQFYNCHRPRQFISSGGLGTMGFGFPAAMGAKVGVPEATVFDIAGDGSFQMNIQELATVSLEKIPVKIAILNNAYLGMVRQWQELFYKRRYSCTHLCSDSIPDFVKIAEGYGVLGLRACCPDEVQGVIERAIEHEGPVVMDFRVCKEENVYPMVAPGSPLKEMIGGADYPVEKIHPEKAEEPFL